MRNLYEITTYDGLHLCYQVACNEKEALDFARMYGHRNARRAVFVRED